MKLTLKDRSLVFVAPQHIMFIVPVDAQTSKVHVAVEHYFTAAEDAETVDRRRIVAMRNQRAVTE